MGKPFPYPFAFGVPAKVKKMGFTTTVRCSETCLWYSSARQIPNNRRPVVFRPTVNTPSSHQGNMGSDVIHHMPPGQSYGPQVMAQSSRKPTGAKGTTHINEIARSQDNFS